MTDPFRNNFHLLRFLLASLVMLSHGNYVFGTGFEGKLFHSAELAVDGFFIISGFLISWSIDRTFEWKSYTIKRFARIYPLYFVVILLQVPVMLYFSSEVVPMGDIAAYLAANLSTLNFFKPWIGDMVDFPFNGSLWTIKIEVMFYIALPIYIWCCKRFGLAWVIATWISAFIYRYTMDDYSLQLARQLPGAMTFFIGGYVMHHYGAQIIAWMKTRWWRLPLLCALLALADFALPGEYGFRLVYLFALMAVIYFIAFYVPQIRLRYDISYGIYLIHFPLFVTVSHLGVLAGEPLYAFLFGCTAVCVLSFLANIAIEEPAIRWGKTQSKRKLKET